MTARQGDRADPGSKAGSSLQRKVEVTRETLPGTQDVWIVRSSLKPESGESTGRESELSVVAKKSGNSDGAKGEW